MKNSRHARKGFVAALIAAIACLVLVRTESSAQSVVAATQTLKAVPPLHDWWPDGPSGLRVKSLSV
jgi:hypothetical protein